MDRQSKIRSAFKRLANRRVNKVLKDLQLVGNLANPQNYSYTDKEIKMIFKAIESELSLTKSKFRIILSKKSNSIKIN